VSQFDVSASSWDESPTRIELAKAVSAAMRDELSSASWKSGLEIGCGTGLVGLSLADLFSSLVLTDSSQKMLDMVRAKLEKKLLPTVSTWKFDMETEQPPKEWNPNVVFSSMVFHHFKDVPSVCDKIARLLVPGGHLLVADLLPEDGSFHEGREDVHKGFEIPHLSAIVRNAGFSQVRMNRIYTLEKKGKEYGIFLLAAQRN
jgi:ubiquinone/menaquinone biosynthesis C-methylase UbiE